MGPTDLDWPSDWPSTCIITLEMPRNHSTGSWPWQPSLDLVLILKFELTSQFYLRPASAPGTCLLIWALGWTQLPSLGVPCCLIQGKWNGSLAGEAHALPAVTSVLAPTSPSHRQQLVIAAFSASNCYANTKEWVNLRSYSYCHKG